ncbi:uroporphyrinogen decarboxylase [Flammeovirga sp. SJP92]|nr:uroporphyrinogen decarboxylase [Flammeovirga sp. SJP92]
MEFSPEYVGYLASLLLMISFSLKNVKLLRTVNSIGCIVFVIYGIMLSAWPIVITNGFIAMINIFYLVKDKK